jgi:uncharacterized protein (TIGR02757 family)
VARPTASLADLPRTLEDLRGRFDARYLETDPVGIVRRFENPEDREIVGLLAAGLAYGRVGSIRASLERLLAVLGPSPARFVAALDLRRDARRFDGFRHRFTDGRDVARFLHLVGRAKERHGSLESLFVDGDPDPSGPTIGPALDAFGARLFALDGPTPARKGARWLLPLPSGGSACKRSCLFLRWMVRRDDGVDCGLWRRVSPSRLVLPLDTHLARIVRALGWTRRAAPSWRMALEATDRLRAFDPADPIRFDFALCRLGILGRLDPRRRRLTRPALARALESR